MVFILQQVEPLPWHGDATPTCCLSWESEIDRCKESDGTHLVKAKESAYYNKNFVAIEFFSVPAGDPWNTQCNSRHRRFIIENGESETTQKKNH